MFSLTSTLIVVYLLLGAAVLIKGILQQQQNVKDIPADTWLVAITASLFWLPIIIILLAIKITKPIQRRYQRWQARRAVLKIEAQEKRDAIIWAQADAEMIAYWKRKAIDDERKRQQDILSRIPA